MRQSELLDIVKFYFFSVCLGGVFGVLTKTLCFPLETLKVNLQLNTQKGAGFFEYIRILSSQSSGIYSLLFFFRGNNVIIEFLIHFFNQTVNIVLKGKVRSLILRGRRSTSKSTLVASILSGGIVGSIALLFVYPFHFARTRVIVAGTDVGEYTGIIDCLVKVLQQEGFFTIYSGFLTNVLYLFLFRVVFLVSYHYVNRIIVVKNVNRNRRIIQWTVGTSSNILTQYIVYPFDTLLKRQQIIGGKNNVFTCLLSMAKEGGLKTFYRGFIVNATRIVFSSILSNIFGDLLQKPMRKLVEKKLMKTN